MNHHADALRSILARHPVTVVERREYWLLSPLYGSSSGDWVYYYPEDGRCKRRGEGPWTQLKGNPAVVAEKLMGLVRRVN